MIVALPIPSEVEQRTRISGKLLKTVLVMRWLGRLAETDLVGCDHPIASLAECADGALPGRGAEILPVQQHDGTTVRLRRFHIQKRHVQGDALRGEAEMRHRRRVVEPLKLGSVCWAGVIGCGAGPPWRGDGETEVTSRSPPGLRERCFMASLCPAAVAGTACSRIATCPATFQPLLCAVGWKNWPNGRSGTSDKAWPELRRRVSARRDRLPPPPQSGCMGSSSWKPGNSFGN